MASLDAVVIVYIHCIIPRIKCFYIRVEINGELETNINALLELYSYLAGQQYLGIGYGVAI